MSDFEYILKQALAGIRKYPDEIEELALQMHNISKAIQSECDKHGISYDNGTNIVSAP